MAFLFMLFSSEKGLRARKLLSKENTPTGTTPDQIPGWILHPQLQAGMMLASERQSEEGIFFLLLLLFLVVGVERKY